MEKPVIKKFKLNQEKEKRVDAGCGRYAPTVCGGVSTSPGSLCPSMKHGLIHKILIK